MLIDYICCLLKWFSAERYLCLSFAAFTRTSNKPNYSKPCRLIRFLSINAAYTRPLHGAILSRKRTSAHALGRTGYGPAENANGNTAVLT